MAIETITAIAIVSGFIINGIIGGVLKEAGKDVYEGAKGLLKPEELIQLNLLEQVPDSAMQQEKVKNLLETRLAENPDITQKLAEMIEKLPKSEIKHNTITQIGDGNITIQDVSGSSVTINK
jgi:hypothetical protein